MRAVETIGALLPGLASEVGLPVGPKAAAKLAVPPRCDLGAWSLADLRSVAAPVERACQAIVVGSLLPEFEPTFAQRALAMTPAKLAWLSAAYVEAEPGSTDPLRQAIRDLALSQLKLAEPKAPTSNHAASKDPVISPLAKLLSARRRTAGMPVRSVREALDRYLQEASEKLPDFSRAVFEERATFEEPFRQVDLCAIEREYPRMMIRPPCRDGAATSAPRRDGPASQLQTAIYQEWRIASHFKDMKYYGQTLGKRDAFERALRVMPADVAAHPFIAQLRYTLESVENESGSFDAYLERLRAAAQSFVQSTVNLQNYSSWLAGASLSEHYSVRNTNVSSDAALQRITDDEQRLVYVLRFDLFAFEAPSVNGRAVGSSAAFLAPPPFRLRNLMGTFSYPRPTGVKVEEPPAWVTAPPPPKTMFPIHQAEPDHPDRATLEARITANPNDMWPRTQLAVLLLKEGRSVTQARAIVDARPANRRDDEQVSESHDWALPAHGLYFAGELDAAKHYYQRVRQIGTGSDSDMHARVRLRLIDGDLPGAILATEARVRRYDGDFSRRDLSSLLFMSGQMDKAWQAVTPRLPVATTFQLWVAPYVGHRITGTSLRQARDWAGRPEWSRAQIDTESTPSMYLHLYAVTDRVPTDSDIKLLGDGLGTPNYHDSLWATSATLVRMALSDTYPLDQFQALRSTLTQGDAKTNQFMQPLYAWVAWHATQGKDVELDEMRKATTQWGFDALLSKATLLALDGKVGDASKYLTAARYEMANLGLGQMVDRPIPAPYQYALALYLMHRKTGEEAYRREALRFVRGYEKVFPFWGWMYGMEAFMERDSKARSIAACRAQYLDAQSMFLKASRVAVDLKSTVCKQALWQ